MRTFLLLVVSILAPQAAGQDQPPRVQPVGLAHAITRASGLQAHPDGDGLFAFGATYTARLRPGGVRFDATSAPGEPPAFVALSAPTAMRGGAALPILTGVAPVAHDRRASYGRADDIDERFDVGADGIELSWRFVARPPGEGDLVVRYAVETSLGEPVAADGGVTFEGPHGGVSVGRVTGVDDLGRSVAGAVQWDGSGLRFSLPAEFVDDAAYPIVLDPVLGSTFLVVGPGLTTLGDAAYDAASDRWLIAWKTTGTSHDILLAQLVANATGALLGNAIMLALASEVTAPRVTNHATRGEFAIAFATYTTAPVSSNVAVARVAAATGAVLSPTTVATSSTSHVHTAVNIGCRAAPAVGSPSGFTVTYRKGVTGVAIMAQRLTYLPAGTLAVGAAVPLWANTSTTNFDSLRMSRTAGADGRLVAVAVRATNGSTFTVVGTLLDTDADSPVFTGDLVPDTGSPTSGLTSIDVDGTAGRWVLGYQAAGSLAGNTVVRVRPLTFDAVSGSLVLASGSTFGAGIGGSAYYPLVAYAAGRAWVAYVSESTFPTTGYRRQVVAVDAGSCASCVDSFSVLVPGTSLPSALALNRCLATTTSGGAVNGEDALFVWADPASSGTVNLFAQRLRDFSTTGTTTSLGGGCGTTGAVAFDHLPGIGSSGFRCRLNGIPATGLLSIFNLSPPVGTVACGACVWTPFAVTRTVPIVGGAAAVDFPIPCLLSLVGQQFDAQWTLLDFGQAPCASFPGLALSNRTRLTIGN